MKLIHQTLYVLAPISLAALLAGCAQPPAQMNEPHFAPDDSSRAMWQVIDRQTALGARDGATLNAMDFDGAELNGLGTSHLEAMMREKPPTVVYVNVSPRDSMTGARVDAVTRYLAQAATAGAEGDNPGPARSIRVAVGANWANHSDAVDGLSRITKTENPTVKAGDFSTSATDAPAMSGGVK